FFMSVLVVDGLYSFTWYGSAGAGHVRNVGQMPLRRTTLISTYLGAPQPIRCRIPHALYGFADP
ncbi:hypothetical protein, partial [Xanthomonas campestris]